MTTTLGDKYLPDWDGKPPHMSPEDLVLWKATKEQITEASVEIYYDVGLGGDDNPPPGTTPEMARMWLRNTQKRADVVIKYPSHWAIVELRDNAQLSAIGRLYGYGLLWQEDPPDTLPAKLILVTNRWEKDVARAADAQNMIYWVVPQT